MATTKKRAPAATGTRREKRAAPRRARRMTTEEFWAEMERIWDSLTDEEWAKLPRNGSLRAEEWLEGPEMLQ